MHINKIHPTLRVDVDGTRIGRKEIECGQMGVINIAGTRGCTIDPPAET